MPDLDKSGEVTSVYCCCFKKAMVNKLPSYSNFNYSQLQEVLKVPYSKEVPKNLSEGSVIQVIGSIKSKCSRFAIDLICKKEKSTDIAFHFNPRLDRHYIVRNSYISDRWGVEETAASVKWDLANEQNFGIIYLITKNSFMVSVNGKHFCTFKFRVSLHSITNIEVLGEVEIFNVEFTKWNIYPEVKGDAEQLVINVNDDAEQPKELLRAPCAAHLPNGFLDDWQLEIHGRVKLLPHSFLINLQDGVQVWPHPVIPLHINPIFKSAVSSENVIIRNACVDGHWGHVERSPVFPFSPGTPFCIAIRRSIDNFSMWVDGHLIGEFRVRSRIPIHGLLIEGDVIVQKILLHNRFRELKAPIQETIKL